MRNRKLIAMFAVAGVAAATALAVQAVRVNLNGKSIQGRMIQGSVYVKLSDVASAYNQTLSSSGGTYTVGDAGGANMLKGTKGKIGEEIFTGQWKFLVTEVQRADKYNLKYADSKFEMDAFESEFIIVHCQQKNAIQKTVSVFFNGLGNTSLADSKAESHKPAWVDVAGGVASDMLPGSTKKFALVFKVPRGTEPKDLVYTIEPVSSEYKKVDLRISMK